MNDLKIIHQAEFNPKISKYILVYVALILFITIIGIPLLLVWFLGVGQSISKRYYQNLRCHLSEQHLEFKKGVFFKVEKTIPLENIQDLTFIENPILNYFDLKILKVETAGNSGSPEADMKLVGIIDSAEFKKKVLHQRELLKTKPAAISTSEPLNDRSVALLEEIRDLLDDIKNNKGQL
jgi:putative membrane protein